MEILRLCNWVIYNWFWVFLSSVWLLSLAGIINELAIGQFLTLIKHFKTERKYTKNINLRSNLVWNFFPGNVLFFPLQKVTGHLADWSTPKI